jgi:hypothetical protein
MLTEDPISSGLILVVIYAANLASAGDALQPA